MLTQRSEDTQKTTFWFIQQLRTIYIFQAHGEMFSTFGVSLTKAKIPGVIYFNSSTNDCAQDTRKHVYVQYKKNMNYALCIVVLKTHLLWMAYYVSENIFIPQFTEVQFRGFPITILCSFVDQICNLLNILTIFCY